MSTNRLERVEFHGESSLDFDILGFVVLSSVLATIALISRSVPVLIGAMILAPVFDPLIAIPFGVINRDWRLARRGVWNSLVLFGIAFGVCCATAYIVVGNSIVPQELNKGPEMLGERLIVGWHSVTTALAAGAGGALASASDRRQNLVGVVVAVALVPSLAAAAIGFSRGMPNAWAGMLLFVVNVGGIIFAGLLILALRVATGRAGEEARRQ